MTSEARAAATQATFLSSATVPPGAFRLILAAAVLVSHASALDVGRLAVMLFFYLSGYWTSRIWSEKFARNNIWMFYLSRYWRIFPLFIVITLASAALRALPLNIFNFTLIGVATTGVDPTGVSWSLDLEMQFYLLLPLVAAIAFRAPGVALLASLIVMVFGWWLKYRFGISTVATYLPVFVLGILTYSRSWRPSQRTSTISLVAFGLFCVLTYFTPFFSKKTPDPFDQDIWAMIWMLPLLPYAAHSLTIRSSRLDRHFGNLSYPLYLVHYPIINVMVNRFGENIPIKLAAATVAVVIAILFYLLVDRPVDRVRVRVTEGAREAPPAP